MPANGDIGVKSPLLPNREVHDALPNDVTASGSISVVRLPSSTVLEPPNQRRSRWRSIRVMYFTMFMSSVTFTMTMSTLWPYLQVVDPAATPSFLGWVVACYSLGQLVASPLFGLWSAKRLAREPLLFSLLMQVGSNTFYAYVQSVHGNGGIFLIVARVIMGLASGNAAVVRAYVSGATTVSERTGAMSNVSIFQSVGFILGPVIQTGLVSIGYPGPVEKDWLHFNMYTSPAFLAAVLAVVNLVLVIAVFRLHSVSDSTNINVSVHVDGDSDSDEEEEEAAYQELNRGPPDYVAVGASMFLFFIVFFMFTIFETIGTPLGMDMYGWTKPQAALYMGIMLAAAGVVAIGVFIIVKVLSNKGVDERKLLVSGYIFCLVGFFVYLPWGNQLPAIAEAPIYTAQTPSTTTPTPHLIQSSSHLPWQDGGQEAAWRLQEGKAAWDRTPGDIVHRMHIPSLPQRADVRHRRSPLQQHHQQDKQHFTSKVSMEGDFVDTNVVKSKRHGIQSESNRIFKVSPQSRDSATIITTILLEQTHPSFMDSGAASGSTTATDLTTSTTPPPTSPEITESSIGSSTRTTTTAVKTTVHTKATTTTTIAPTSTTTTATTTKSRPTTTTIDSSTRRETTAAETTSDVKSATAPTSKSSSATAPAAAATTSHHSNSSGSTEASTSEEPPAFTITTTSNSSSSNSTVAPEGCPWTFAWCGTQPMVRLWQFILGTFFIAIGYPICNAMTYSIFSKVLGHKPQGLWMGFITACGSLARTLGPIFVAQIYDAWGPRVTFACSCAVLFITIVVNIATFRSLVPFDLSPFRKGARANRPAASVESGGGSYA